MSSFSTSFDSKIQTVFIILTCRPHFWIIISLPLVKVLSLNAFFRGYHCRKRIQETPIIVGNQHAPGSAAASARSLPHSITPPACQFEIIERHHHRLTVPPIDPGKDATISIIHVI